MHTCTHTHSVIGCGAKIFSRPSSTHSQQTHTLVLRPNRTAHSNRMRTLEYPPNSVHLVCTHARTFARWVRKPKQIINEALRRVRAQQKKHICSSTQTQTHSRSQDRARARTSLEARVHSNRNGGASVRASPDGGSGVAISSDVHPGRLLLLLWLISPSSLSSVCLQLCHTQTLHRFRAIIAN